MIICSLPIFTYGMVTLTVSPARLCKASGLDPRFFRGRGPTTSRGRSRGAHRLENRRS